MKPSPFLYLALLAPFVLAWPVSADAFQNCQSGKTLYNKTNATVPTACSNSSCHGAGVNLHNIGHAAGNPGAIETALDGNGSNPEMLALDLRNNLPLTASDIDDLATYIFYATIPQPCPVAAPNVAATPSAASFGSVNVGSTSATQVITVSNTGAGSATGLNYTNSNSAEFLATKTCDASIAAGATCTITLSYKPSSAGADSATYSITGSGGVNVSIALSGTGGAAPAASLQSTPSLLAFGNVTVGQTSAAIAVTVSNSGGAVASGMVLANSNATEFVVTGNTCGATLNAGGSCALIVAYRPSAVGADSATLTINYAGGGALSISLSGAGITGTPPPSGQLSLPGAVTMTSQNVGTASAPHPVTLSNVGTASVIVTAITSSNAAEFPVSASTCTTVNVGASCTFNITFQPSATGARSATIMVASSGTGSPQTIAVTGAGASGSGPPTAAAVEYYNAALDHYFLTHIANEIAILDAGVQIQGWKRTGQSFPVWIAAGVGTSPVCRYYIPPGLGNSHFYGRGTVECNNTGQSNPSFVNEDPQFFHVVLPVAGLCPSGTQVVYRVFSNRPDANHRYTIVRALRDQMVVLGWLAEGDGPDLVVMCVPQ